MAWLYLSLEQSTGPAPPRSLPPWSTSIPCEPWRNRPHQRPLGMPLRPGEGVAGIPLGPGAVVEAACPREQLPWLGGHPAPSHFSLSLA